MRMVSQALMEAGADFSDGIRLENEAGQVRIMPANDSESVVISAKATDPSKSTALAEGFMGLVKGLDSSR